MSEIVDYAQVAGRIPERNTTRDACRLLRTRETNRGKSCVRGPSMWEARTHAGVLTRESSGSTVNFSCGVRPLRYAFGARGHFSRNRFQACPSGPRNEFGLHSLLKNSRFVSGYRFSDTASRLKSDAPLGAGHWNSTFSPICSAPEGIGSSRRGSSFFPRRRGWKPPP